MRIIRLSIAIMAIAVTLLPNISNAQAVTQDVGGLQSVLDQLYNEMLPLCSKLIDTGRLIAAFAATWYIASRVWRQISNAEPIDFYPLFRPFVLGFAIMIFPAVIGLLNGILEPAVSGTNAMVKNSNKAIEMLLAKKQEAIQQSSAWQMYVGSTGEGDRDQWYQYTHPDDVSGNGEGILSGIGNDIKFAMAKASYNFRNSIKQWMSEVLELLYEAAALCINTLRTFQLLILAILGPLVFAFAVFDGFQHTLVVWIARYINVFLWLPIANIFGSMIGKIQEQMLQLDINQISEQGDTFFSATDTGYLIFMIIAILGYTTVPAIASYVVNAGGGNALMSKVSRMSSSTIGAAGSMASGGAGMAADALGGAANQLRNGMSSFGVSGGYFNENAGADDSNKHQHNKLSGN